MHKGFNLKKVNEEIKLLILEIMKIGWRNYEKTGNPETKKTLEAIYQNYLKFTGKT